MYTIIDYTKTTHAHTRTNDILSCCQHTYLCVYTFREFRDEIFVFFIQLVFNIKHEIVIGFLLYKKPLMANFVYALLYALNIETTLCLIKFNYSVRSIILKMFK